METFSALLAICAGNSHRSPVNSSHKGQWRGALMFSLICAWINGWVKNRKAGDLRRHRAHYDVSVMKMWLHSGSSMARYHQFDDIVRWTKEYREILRDPNEVIVFDVVAGDFNMCNMSPGNVDLIPGILWRYELHYRKQLVVLGWIWQPWRSQAEMACMHKLSFSQRWKGRSPAG